MPNDSYLQRLSRVEPYAQLRRDDGKVVEHRIGLYATLYFDHFHPLIDTNEKSREALIECWRDYWSLVGQENRKWTYGFESGVRAYKLPTEKAPPIDVFLRDPEHFGNYQYYTHGGVHKYDASEYVFDAAGFPVYGAPKIRQRLGYLRLHAPLAYIRDGRLQQFVELTKRCALRLRVDQGHGGLGFLRTYDEENTTRNTEGQLSKVFSGVDVDVPYVQMGRLYREEQGHLGIDGPHWLNFLGGRWIAKLGGIDALRALLPEESFVVEAYDGGVFIQAGPAPEPGHQQDGLPPAYVWLNRVLLPVRAPEMVYCLGDEPGQLARHQGARAYFTRFDAASARLTFESPQGDSSNTRGSKGDIATSGVVLRCQAGQPCPRTGWWFTPAQPDSRRRFEAGEAMPELGGDYGTTIWQWADEQGR